MFLSNFFFFFWSNSPQWARASSFLRFLDHTQRHITVGRTPLDEWSARRRDLYLTTHNTHKRQTYVHLVGFESTIPASERPQTYAGRKVYVTKIFRWQQRESSPRPSTYSECLNQLPRAVNEPQVFALIVECLDCGQKENSKWNDFMKKRKSEFGNSPFPPERPTILHMIQETSHSASLWVLAPICCRWGLKGSTCLARTRSLVFELTVPESALPHEMENMPWSAATPQVRCLCVCFAFSTKLLSFLFSLKKQAAHFSFAKFSQTLMYDITFPFLRDRTGFVKIFRDMK